MCFSESERDMALEAALLYSQQQQPPPPPLDPFSPHGSIKDLFDFNLFLPNCPHPDFTLHKHHHHHHHHQQHHSSLSFLHNSNAQTQNFPFSGEWNDNNNGNNCSSVLPQINGVSEVVIDDDDDGGGGNMESSAAQAPPRPKRRRAKSRKNKEEIENQRMTHIAVERNRRKLMNEYLSLLRSLMPHSYVQRSDQASIIGGAINYVKELEQKLQFIGSQKEIDGGSDAGAAVPFSEFFAFPQYSTTTSGGSSSSSVCENSGEGVSEVKPAGIADIEVTMVESHANLKIRSKKRPKQLLKVVSGLHGMRLTILHLNVTTTGDIVLYSISVKVEDDCKLGSVDEIASAVYQMLDRIQQEAKAMLN